MTRLSLTSVGHAPASPPDSYRQPCVLAASPSLTGEARRTVSLVSPNHHFLNMHRGAMRYANQPMPRINHASRYAWIYLSAPGLALAYSRSPHSNAQLLPDDPSTRPEATK